MPSQLYTNDKISFLAARPFHYGAHDYELGDDFPQEEANNIETLVRARYVIPVVDSLLDKPRHWHKEVRTREQAEEYLTRSRVQLRMPAEPDSDEVVNIPQLTHPETTPEPEETPPEGAEEEAEAGAGEEAAPAEAVHSEQYDPSYHTVRDVNEYLAHVHDPEEKERILQAERDGKGRKGILEA